MIGYGYFKLGTYNCAREKNPENALSKQRDKLLTIPQFIHQIHPKILGSMFFVINCHSIEKKKIDIVQKLP